MLAELIGWTKDTFSSLGVAGLFLLAVIESIFFPVPVDVLLIVMAVAEPNLWWFFAIVATIGSVLGAIIGYRIGYWGEEAILKRFFPERYIRRVHDLFEKYESLAIFIAGFTPLPYKVFAVGAGVFYVSFVPFVVVSFISRGLRFFLVAFLAAWVAEHAVSGPFMNWLMVLGVLLAAWFWVGFRILKR